MYVQWFIKQLVKKTDHDANYGVVSKKIRGLGRGNECHFGKKIMLINRPISISISIPQNTQPE